MITEDLKMFPVERQQAIIQILKTKKSMTVIELSKTLFIGEATIRRDLEKLAKANLLQRTHGGAVLEEGLDREIPLAVRETAQIGAKNRIGTLAAQFVHDGDTIIIDSSSTSLKMVAVLRTKERLTVITNGAKAVIELGESHFARVYCTGGILRENSLSFIGQQARVSIENYSADYLFFSCRGLSIEKGLTDSSEDEAELRRVMAQNSRKVILLCDHTKFDTVSFCKVMDFKAIHCLITDQKPDSRWTEFLHAKGIQVLY